MREIHRPQVRPPPMHVTAIHPAPVRLVPPGGRHERVALVRCETPAEVPEVDAGVFEPFPLSLPNVPLHVRDDGIWATIRAFSRYEDRDGSFDPDDFRAWLRHGTGDADADGFLALRLRRSPLVAALPGGPDPDVPVSDLERRGEAMPRARGVMHDTREAAAAAVARMLARDFAIVGDEVRMRVRPLAFLQGDGPAIPARLHLHPHYRDGGGLAVGPLRVSAAMEAHHPGLEAEPTPDLEAFLAAAEGRPDPMDDRAWLASSAAAGVHHTARILAKDDPDGVGRLERRLAALTDLAMIGAIPQGHVAQALGILHEATSLLIPLSERLPRKETRTHLWRLAVHLESGVLAGPAELRDAIPVPGR